MINSEIALLIQPVRVEPARVTWAAFTSTSSFFARRSRVANLSDYTHWLSEGHFSALLFDGAMLQITYDVAAGEVVGHRLAYVPCPFEVDPDDLSTGDLVEVMELYAAGGADAVALQTAVRFDFDLLAATSEHPAAHMTINTSDCRIACAAPLRLGHFFDFVMRHFYRDLWNVHPYFDGMSRTDWGDRTLTEDDEARLHVAWRAS